jgi:hypothetical protein
LRGAGHEADLVRVVQYLVYEAQEKLDAAKRHQVNPPSSEEVPF